MAYWALVIFCLGLFSLLFQIFNIFTWFTPFWGIILMLVAFAMLTRIAAKEKQGEKEALKRSIEELEAKLSQVEGVTEKKE